MITPLLHVYEAAPPPVNVILPPAQTTVEVAFAVTVGREFTLTVTEAVLTQPFPSVPVTTYVCVDTGVNGFPFPTPWFQVYELAPLPVKVTLPPEQTTVDVAFAVTEGKGFTLIIFVAVLLQPFAPVPVTTYVWVDAGVNETPSVTPWFQLYEVAPPPVSVTFPPEHTTVDVAFAVTVGREFTVTIIVAVPVQPFPSVPVTT